MMSCWQWVIRVRFLGIRFDEWTDVLSAAGQSIEFGITAVNWINDDVPALMPLSEKSFSDL
jgi:hypothetical protein